jgi:hypothetical protein
MTPNKIKSLDAGSPSRLRLLELRVRPTPTFKEKAFTPLLAKLILEEPRREIEADPDLKQALALSSLPDWSPDEIRDPAGKLHQMAKADAAYNFEYLANNVGARTVVAHRHIRGHARLRLAGSALARVFAPQD